MTRLENSSALATAAAWLGSFGSGMVGRKTHLVEHCGRHHLSYQLIGGYHRAAIDKTFMHPSRVST